MEYIPVAIQVLIDWILVLAGTISPFFRKKNEDE